MDLKTEIKNSAAVVTVQARRIDSAAAIQFKDAMRSATGAVKGRIVLDLAQVHFVDSSGLGAIVAAMKTLGPERRLDLAGLTPDVDKVFRLTRMDTIFDIYPDTGAALRRAAG